MTTRRDFLKLSATFGACTVLPILTGDNQEADQDERLKKALYHDTCRLRLIKTIAEGSAVDENLEWHYWVARSPTHHDYEVFRPYAHIIAGFRPGTSEMAVRLEAFNSEHLGATPRVLDRTNEQLVAALRDTNLGEWEHFKGYRPPRQLFDYTLKSFTTHRGRTILIGGREAEDGYRRAFREGRASWV